VEALADKNVGLKGGGAFDLIFYHFSPFIGANDVRKCPDEPEESYYNTGSQSTHRCCPFRVTLSKSALSTEHNQKQKVEPKTKYVSIKYPLLRKIRTHSYYMVFGPPTSSSPKRHLDRFNRFCRAHQCIQHSHKRRQRQ